MSDGSVSECSDSYLSDRFLHLGVEGSSYSSYEEDEGSKKHKKCVISETDPLTKRKYSNKCPSTNFTNRAFYFTNRDFYFRSWLFYVTHIPN